jgi:hypothetical protein
VKNLAVALLLSIAVSACASHTAAGTASVGSAANPFAGKWEMSDRRAALDFHDDGSVTQYSVAEDGSSSTSSNTRYTVTTPTTATVTDSLGEAITVRLHKDASLDDGVNSQPYRRVVSIMLASPSPVKKTSERL